MNKQNKIIIIILVIVVLAIIAFLTLKNRNTKLTPKSESQIEIDLNQAVSADSTTDINNSLNDINLDDTSNTDLQDVDKELNNL